MRTGFRVVALMASLFPLPALAQTTEPAVRKGELQAACSADVEKHCANAPRGKGQLRSCLEGHQAELSDACRAAMAARPNVKSWLMVDRCDRHRTSGCEVGKDAAFCQGID